jgi:hypothetical protein
MELWVDGIRPGILITAPPSGGLYDDCVLGGKSRATARWASSSCRAPACGVATTSYAFVYEPTGTSTQKYRQVTGTGTFYSLKSGGTEVETALVPTNTWTLPSRRGSHASARDPSTLQRKATGGKIETTGNPSGHSRNRCELLSSYS